MSVRIDLESVPGDNLLHVHMEEGCAYPLELPTVVLYHNMCAIPFLLSLSHSSRAVASSVALTVNRSLQEHLKQFVGEPVIFAAVEHVCEMLPNLVFVQMKEAAKKHEASSTSPAVSEQGGNRGGRRGRGRGRRGGRRGEGGRRVSAPKPILISEDVKKRIASLQSVRIEKRLEQPFTSA